MTDGNSHRLEKQYHNAYKRPVDVCVMERLFLEANRAFFPIKVPRFEGDADLRF